MEKERHVAVVVLGDFGRSPRMQYHTLSLAENNYCVDVVAYAGSDPLKQLQHNPLVKFHYLVNTPEIFGLLPGILRYGFKTAWQGFFLLFTLLRISLIDCILLQNPPAIPTLPVIYFISWWKKCKFVIDFHNYGYTIMELTAGKKSILVKFAKLCEKFFSRTADKSICVSKAMKSDLAKNWNIRSTVFYDCAPSIFRPISLEEKHSFFIKLSKVHPHFQAKLKETEECTRFTKVVDNKIQLQEDRPALLVSSTSWTEDEDFSVFLTALEEYEEAAEFSNDLPDLLVAITGKGPLKNFYEKEIKSKGFKHVEIITMWLKSEDYPIFLACADLGISLHTSSSGLDLPMKVVDMFGCCLPVCVFDFDCVSELVKDGVNGRVFWSSHQLNLQLQDLLSGFPKKKGELAKFHENLKKSGILKWDENWNHTVCPIFDELT